MNFGASAVEYLQNGGFESGSFSGWSLVDPDHYSTVETSTYPPQAGSAIAYVGNLSTAPGELSQSFTDVAGETLVITGYAIGDSVLPPDSFGSVSYFFNGTLLGSPDLSPGNVWVKSSFSVTAQGHDTFSIRYYNDASFSGLDSFSVSSGVPELSTWTLALAGFASLGWAYRLKAASRERRSVRRS